MINLLGLLSIKDWLLGALVAVLVLAGVFGAGYYKGHAAEAERFAAYRAQVVAQGEAAAARVAQVKRADERIYKETVDGYASAIAVLRDRLDRVRIKPRGRTVPATPPAAQGTDAGAGGELLGSGLRAPTPTDAEQIRADCAQSVAQLLWLQDWVRRTAINEGEG